MLSAIYHVLFSESHGFYMNGENPIIEVVRNYVCSFNIQLFIGATSQQHSVPSSDFSIVQSLSFVKILVSRGRFYYSKA